MIPPNKVPDIDMLQVVGSGQIGYSRRILSADKKRIWDCYKNYGGLTPPVTEHEGIEDCFVGKASGIHFYYRGKWLKLTGAD
jgi:hypothetical protein